MVGSGAVDFANGHNASSALEALRLRWQARRAELARLHALVDGAQLCDELLTELDNAVRSSADDLVTLKQAAALSGYSADHLGRLLRDGTLRNSGRRNAPRIRRADLPRKTQTLPDAPESSIVSAVRRRIVRNVAHSE